MRKESSRQKISFVGYGNMASAIIRGLLISDYPPELLMISNPSLDKLTQISDQTTISTTTDNKLSVEFADIVILAIKPQVLPTVCTQLSDIDLSNKLIISIAAGITTRKISILLKQELPIVRAMPNTPALISEGATGLFANNLTSESQKRQVETIFNAVGQTEWVTDEPLIDVVTAIAGSSPAYIFMFIQSMVEQAVAEGMDQSSALKLATQAVVGAGKLIQQSDQTNLTELRNKVTSPGGTTAAAIASFEQNAFSNTIKQAVSAAIIRGKKLGEQA